MTKKKKLTFIENLVISNNTEQTNTNMSDKKDYSKLTNEELLIEEKKTKKNLMISAAIIGFLLAPIIYGIVKGTEGYVYIIVPIILIFGIHKNSKKLKNTLKQIKAETEAKTAN